MVVEGNHYFPLESVHRELLVPSTHTSVCPWKGTANYYSLNVAGAENKDAVWYYAEPEGRGEGDQGPRRVLEGREGHPVATEMRV